MARTLLYYPNIKFPSDQWLKDSLLYWDEVGSIVPERLLSFSSRTQAYLESEGIYKRFDPEEALGDFRAAEELANELEHRLTSPHFDRESQAPEGGEYWNIAFDKLGYPAYKVLRNRGLALPNPSAKQWCWVKKAAAFLYMGLLARLLASRSSGYVQPSTDHASYEDMIYRSGSGENSVPGLALLLRNSLPRVTPDTDLAKLIKFRTKRRNELLTFRKLIDDTQLRLSQCGGPEEARLVLTQFQEEFELNVNLIRRLTQDQGIHTWVGTLRAIFGVKSPAFVGLIAGGLGGAALSPHGLAMTLSGAAGFSGGAAIELAGYSLNVKEEKRKLLEQPFSYLFSAQQEEII